MGERIMPEWEHELREMLAHLDVLYDGGDPQPRALHLDDESHTGGDDSDTRGYGDLDASMLAMEAGAVRTDMEATLARLDQLTSAGQLDRTVRDDFVIAMRALVRSLPSRPTPAQRAEWQLTSAAAALHLSRAVMRLSFRMAPPLER
jgi:hypothetical protein